MLGQMKVTDGIKIEVKIEVFASRIRSCFLIVPLAVGAARGLLKALCVGILGATGIVGRGSVEVLKVVEL